MRDPFLASYERGVELMAAGIPLDYLDALPHQSFRAEQLPGYVESCVYAIGPRETRWVIALRLATDRSSGTVITDWSFEQPWKDHEIEWYYEPEDIILKEHQHVYKSLFKSRMTDVLKGFRLIRRGSTVDGLVCGCSSHPIGEDFHDGIRAELRFTDDLGNTVTVCIYLNVYKHLYLNYSRLVEAGQRPSRYRLRTLFTEQDPMSGSEREPGKPPDFAGFPRDRDSDNAFSLSAAEFPMARRLLATEVD